MVNGRETLRLRSKGAATVQEVVSPSGKRPLVSFPPQDSCETQTKAAAADGEACFSSG